MTLKNKLAKFVPGNLYKSSDFLFYTQWWRQDEEGYSIRTHLSIDGKVILYLGPLNSKHGEFLIDGIIWYSSISSDDRPSFVSEEKEMFGEK